MGYTIWPDSADGDVLSDIHRERSRQEELRAAGKFPWTCASPDVDDSGKLAVLAEEFGEVARAVVESRIDIGAARSRSAARRTGAGRCRVCGLV
jgi:hypothetical protein